VKGRKDFFFEKKKQKVLIISASVFPEGAGPDLQSRRPAPGPGCRRGVSV
jgi:hypothetical protein